ncbi:MAG TPA: SprT-like domain-containing protein [Acidobacteriota bacterium]|nr:SprT-like domain-containing protein [Acidobacteriota bacterium]
MDSALAGRLQALCRLHWEDCEGSPPPRFSLRFYPYANLHHTIRLRGQTVYLRLSDILCDAPEPVLSAIAVILLYKLMRRQPPAAERRLYARFVAREETRERCRRVRRKRGRKHLTAEQGRHFDLRSLCEDLNRRYFDGHLTIKRLSWSRRRNRRVLGHYDYAHNTIVIDRRLDHPRVPAYVVEFVIYHEMLHALFGERFQGGRRFVHHADFRRAERQFHDYQRAQDFIRNRLPAAR